MRFLKNCLEGLKIALSDTIFQISLNFQNINLRIDKEAHQSISILEFSCVPSEQSYRCKANNQV